MAFYRYECVWMRYPHRTEGTEQWEGIFQFLDPDQRRKWYCLPVPKWYSQHPNSDSKAWFTEHGFQKYGEKMRKALEHFCELHDESFVIRLLVAEKLPNLVMTGKTQCIQKVRPSRYYDKPGEDTKILFYDREKGQFKAA